jgi:seryl-tRNA synthetase
MNLFGTKKKEEKKEVKTVDLMETSNRLGGNISNVKEKLEAVDKELKVALETYRNARNPAIKQQAKTKCNNILKKKKMYEAHLNNLNNTQFNVENAHIQTQMIRDNIDIVTIFNTGPNFETNCRCSERHDEGYEHRSNSRHYG